MVKQIPFKKKPQAKDLEYLNVNIKIRKDLITHWGGLVINNFSLNPGTQKIDAENVTAPGFTFDVPKEKGGATFTITTSQEEVKSARKKRAKRARRSTKRNN